MVQSLAYLQCAVYLRHRGRTKWVGRSTCCSIVTVVYFSRWMAGLTKSPYTLSAPRDP